MEYDIKTIVTEKATVRVHIPVLTEPERAVREAEVRLALEIYGRNVKKQK